MSQNDHETVYDKLLELCNKKEELTDEECQEACKLARVLKQHHSLGDGQ